VGSSSSARPKPIHLCEVVLQQRMFPGCDPFRTEEERPTMFFIQVPFPSRRHWVSECLPRNVNQPRFGLRVDAEIACVAKDHAPRQHRIVDAEGGWDGGVSQATEASMTLLTEATREHYEFTANVYMIPGPAYIRVRLQQAHNAYCKQHQPDNTFNAPVGFLPFRRTDPRNHVRLRLRAQPTATLYTGLTGAHRARTH
jgi:hypothetical protein